MCPTMAGRRSTRCAAADGVSATSTERPQPHGRSSGTTGETSLIMGGRSRPQRRSAQPYRRCSVTMLHARKPTVPTAINDMKTMFRMTISTPFRPCRLATQAGPNTECGAHGRGAGVDVRDLGTSFLAYHASRPLVGDDPRAVARPVPAPNRVATTGSLARVASRLVELTERFAAEPTARSTWCCRSPRKSSPRGAPHRASQRPGRSARSGQWGSSKPTGGVSRSSISIASARTLLRDDLPAGKIPGWRGFVRTRRWRR